MSDRVEIYDSQYGNAEEDVQTAVRRATWDEDLGQVSWITLAEARTFFNLLGASRGRNILEIACGAGGVALRMARETGARIVGVDVNEHAIATARAAAARTEAAAGPVAGSAVEPGAATGTSVEFRVVDASKPLPFDNGSFDAIFCNDAINHLPDRASVLADWRRLLRAGGRVLYTDPIVVTGQLSSAEIAARSSIGFFLFTPPGENERQLAAAGFDVVESRDVTENVAAVSRRWRAARNENEAALVKLEGRDEFDGVQRFLAIVHALASERRLSRFAYVAEARG